MQLLLVEDNKKMAENIATVLRHEQYNVDVALMGKDALEFIETNTYDLIILDLSLPDIDGQEICKRVRTMGNVVPILMLTARIDLDSKVEGLDGGADDYLTKPFLVDELLARVRAMLRRSSTSKSSLVEIKNISIDLKTKKVKKSGKHITLSPTEISLLEFLVLNRNEPMTHIRIYEAVWGSQNDDILFSDTLKVHIARLRKKIGNEIISTVKGVGYMIE